MNYRCASAFNCRAQFFCIAQEAGKWENGTNNDVSHDWPSFTALQKDSQKFGSFRNLLYLCSDESKKEKKR